jgi:uncharacterized membrane protein
METIFPGTERTFDASRVGYLVGGGLLLALGLKRGSWLGSLVSVVGADLVTKGLSGQHLPEIVGIHGLSRRGERARIAHTEGVKVERSVSVMCTPQEAYQFIRDLEQWPVYMKHVKSVEVLDDRRSHWVVKAPAGTTVEWAAEIINDVPNEVIAWRSINSPDIESAGSLNFEPLPGNRGTMICASFQYLPPAGVVGVAIAKLFGEEPEIQVKDDLRRLKQLLEAGETPTTYGQPRGGKQTDEEEGEKAVMTHVPPKRSRGAASGSKF